MRHPNDNDPHDALNDYLDSLAGAPPPDSHAGDLDLGMRDDVDRFFNLAKRAGVTPDNARRSDVNVTLPVSSTLPAPRHKARRGITLPTWTQHLHLVSTGLLVLAVIALSFAAFGLNGPIGPHNRSPVGTSNQGLYDSDDLSTYPRVPETCEPNGGVTSNVNLAQRSIDDWPEPEYTPAQAVSHEQGLVIQETYLAYLRCELDSFTSVTLAPGDDIPRSPEMLSYYSTRMRYALLDDSELSAEQQEALQEHRCLPRTEEIVASYPLPVNQPKDYAITELMLDDEVRELAFIFAPSDVYLLPDGRYGAIAGTISTAALLNPAELTTDDGLTFIAFVEDDGRYFIDEMFLIVAPDIEQPVVDRPADSPPRTAALYRPVENEMCSAPGE